MIDPSPRPHIPAHQIGIPAAVSELAAEIDWCFCFRRGGESDVSGDQEQEDEARMEDMGESEDMQEQEPDLQSLGLAATTPATFIQKTAWEQTILALQQLGVRDLVTSVLLFLINIPCTSISRMLQCYKRNVPAQHALLMYMQPIIVVMSFRFACHFDFSLSELCFD